jgi:hypothetical protein
VSFQHPLKTIQSAGRCRLLPTVPKYWNIKPLDGGKSRRPWETCAMKTWNCTLLQNF